MIRTTLVVGMIAGCASQSALTGVKNDTVQIKAQMTSMQRTTATSAEIDSLISYVAELEEVIRRQTDLLWSMRADLNSRISNLDDRLQVIDAKVSESDRQFSSLSSKVEGVKAQLSTGVLADTLGNRPVDAEELYNTALTDYQRGNYELAIKQFLQYLQYFPDTELADNAQYWIGDCYYTQQDYTRALDAYDKVLKNYPSGNKVPAALFKIGLSRLAQKDTGGGKTYLERVIGEFPKSEEAKLARMRLEAMLAR
jgi:tol-pal system protein YbgF